jgi:peptide/nickel transport system ATP-binding protein
VSTDSVLEVQRVSVAYQTQRGRVQALEDVSFSLDRGEVMGLVGESGSGKSTLGLAVMRLLVPSACVTGGPVLFKEGTDLLTSSPDEMRRIRGDRIAMVFQDPFSSLTPSLRVGEQLVEAILVHQKIPRSAAWVRAGELFEKVGISATRLRDFPHQLSGGMRQRVSIAIALSCHPDLLILDEPTSALDVTIQATILDLLTDLRTELGLAMLFITHDLGIVARMCDRVTVLYAGRVVERGTTQQILESPAHGYTTGLLASLPGERSAGRRPLSFIPGTLPGQADRIHGCIFAARCPFVEEVCLSTPQSLVPLGLGHDTACVRHQVVARTPWPAPADPRAGSAAVHGAPMLDVRDLAKTFDRSGFWSKFRGSSQDQAVHAVRGVSLTLRAGETLGLVGESGCGKTTLARMIVRLIEPSGGAILYECRDALTMHGAALQGYHRAVQIIFQNPDSSLNPRLRVGDVMRRRLQLLGLDPREHARRISELLALVRLPDQYAARYPHELSGGEKQRVGLARALATQPAVIVCDEPVSALDVSVTAAILNSLIELQASLGVAYLFIAHDLSVVRHVSHRVAMMYRGEICETGTTSEVFEPPYHPYTEALLSAIPRPEYADRYRDRIPLRGSVTAPAGQVKGCPFQDRCPVKIGPVCEEDSPPVVTVSPGHTIRCHHFA